MSSANDPTPLDKTGREGLFRRIVESSSLYVAIFDREWRLTYASPLVENNAERLAVEAKELAGSTAGEQRRNRLELHALDGRSVQVDLIWTNLLHDPVISGYLTVGQVTTEQVMAVEAAAETQARFAAALASSSEAIIGTDVDGSIVAWSKGAERLFGYTSDTILGRNVGVLRPPELEHEGDLVGRAMALGRELRLADTERLRRDGSRVSVAVTVAPVQAGGAYVGASVSYKDLTQEKALERERQQRERAQRLRAIGQLAGGVAHNINNSLGIVLGHAELALINGAAGDARPFLETIKAAAMDGAETVRRLMRFAKAQPDDPPETVQILELLQDVAGWTAPRWREQAQADGRRIAVVVQADPDLSAEGSPSALREALTNLVLNAVDALPAGGVIRLAATTVGDDVEISVTDNGTGMSADVQARLFEPFFTTKGEQGTGLGLAAVFGIVERMGGTIAVDSRPGAGTAVTIRLPPPTSGDAVTSVEATQPDQPSRVLIVEDAAALAEAARLLVTSLGHTATVAPSGEAALSVLETDTFDVILCDLILGDGITGWEVADAVAERGLDVRFVLATGWGAMLDDADLRTHHVDSVLPKPYRRADLMKALRAP